MSTLPLHVLIIGAGTGGLCLAQGLKQADISVAVYERDRTRLGGLQGYWHPGLKSKFAARSL